MRKLIYLSVVSVIFILSINGGAQAQDRGNQSELDLFYAQCTVTSDMDCISKPQLVGDFSRTNVFSE